jgi:hypothetical protein
MDDLVRTVAERIGNVHGVDGLVISPAYTEGGRNEHTNRSSRVL